MLKREQKEQLAKEYADKIKAAKASVFVDYKGVKVNDMNALRSELRKLNIKLKVLKKTVLTVALKNAGVEKNMKEIEGQIAVAVSPEDEIAGAKVLAKVAKGNKNLKIVGGLLGAEELDAERVLSLAKLPGKEELLAKLVGTINAPVSGFVNVLAGNIRGLVNVLKAIGEAKS